MENNKIVYGYDSQTYEFTGVEIAHLCPVTKDMYLIPGNTTELEPTLLDGFACLFIDGKWVHIEDHRGKIIYNTTTKLENEKPVDYLGPIQVGYTDLVPFDFAEWDGYKWVENITEKEASIASQPFKDWLDKMQNTDIAFASLKNIARFMEDFYSKNPDMLAVKQQQFIDTYNERKELRLRRPN